jgi:hypothetical protein
VKTLYDMLSTIETRGLTVLDLDGLRAFARGGAGDVTTTKAAA